MTMVDIISERVMNTAILCNQCGQVNYLSKEFMINDKLQFSGEIKSTQYHSQTIILNTEEYYYIYMHFLFVQISQRPCYTL